MPSYSAMIDAAPAEISANAERAAHRAAMHTGDREIRPRPTDTRLRIADRQRRAAVP